MLIKYGDVLRDLRLAMHMDQESFYGLLCKHADTPDCPVAAPRTRMSRWENAREALPAWARRALYSLILSLWNDDASRAETTQAAYDTHLIWVNIAGFALLHEGLVLLSRTAGVLPRAEYERWVAYVQGIADAYYGMVEISPPGSVADWLPHAGPIAQPNGHVEPARGADGEDRAVRPRLDLSDVLPGFD